MSSVDFNTISLDGLKELLKVSADRQSPDMLTKIKQARKTWYDFALSEKNPKEQRLDAAKKVSEVHKYLGYKEVPWLFGKINGNFGGPGRRVVTKEMRDENAANFLAFLVKNGIHPNNESLAIALSNVYGEP